MSSLHFTYALFSSYLFTMWFFSGMNSESLSDLFQSIMLLKKSPGNTGKPLPEGDALVDRYW